MPRKKGDLSYNTMVELLKKAGLYHPSMDGNKPAIKAAYLAMKNGVAAPAVEEIGREAGERIAAQIRAEPPISLPPELSDRLLDITVVADKTVREWEAIIGAREDAADKRRALDREKLQIIDLTDLPSAAVKAVREWRNKGMHTARSAVRHQEDDLRAQAAKQIEYAQMDEEEARKLVEGAKGMKDERANRERIRAEKKLEQAQKKRAKAAEFEAQANKLAA